MPRTPSPSDTALDAPVSVVHRYPLTPMQHGMLFESALSKRPWVNLQQLVIRLDELLDPEAFRHAWRLVQRRHDALRTSFRWQGLHEPIQEVHDDAPLHYSVDDWREIPSARQRTDLKAFLADDRAEGVDLREPSPMRLRVIRMEADAWVVVWTFHHGVLDGRGFTLVLEEVFTLYEEIRAGATPSLAPAPTMKSHIEAIGRRDVEAANAYFDELLAGLRVAPLSIAGLLPDTGEAGQGNQEVEVRVPKSVVTRLDTLAEDTGTTFYTCLLGAWSLLLSRYGAGNDVVFGSTRAGRHTFDGARDTVGCFINTLPVRVVIDEDAFVESLLRTLRSRSIEVRPHEHTPLVDIQRRCGGGGNPWLTTNVVFERYLLDSFLRAKGGAWASRSVEVLEQGSFPLTLAAYLDGHLSLRFEYDPGVYSKQAITQMSLQFATLLSALSHSDGSTRLRDLRHLDDVALATQKSMGRPEQRILQDTKTYPDLFEAQVQRSAGSIAAASAGFGGERTYAQLDARANRVANGLRDIGIGVGDRVAICLPRSLELADAVLGVLKAGAAYVPLDPKYPDASLRHMLVDSGARAVVTLSSLHEMVPSLRDFECLLLDTHADKLANLSDAAPPRESLSNRDDAYVIYTSGSTGVPKGVVVSHGAVVAHDKALMRLFELQPADRCLQFASFSFDVAVEEMLPTWLAGATLMFRSDAMSESTDALIDAAEENRLSVLNLPTAYWHELVRRMDEGGRRLPPCVRLVIVGGEKASRKSYAAWTRVAPDVRWLNCYGPTEATVTCTAYDPAWGYELSSGQEIPIGRPTDNATAYVLDSRKRPTPVGVWGELWIGGSSLAKGYEGHPERTALSFREDIGFAGERVYNTGDRVRWLPSGDLEFGGRVDRQIKIRGFRVEPGEIESTLVSHPSVDEALVGLRADAAGVERLVAWVRGDAGKLARWTKGVLPPHMIPSAFVTVDAFPLTPGGKVDHGALPGPSFETTRGGGRDPQNDVERLLCRLFAEALGREEVNVEDSFFDLGGQSLLAIRLFDRIEEELGKRPSLAALRVAETPAELAETLIGAATPAWEFIYPIQREGSRPPLFGVHVLGVNGGYFTPLAKHLGRDQPVVGLAIPLTEQGAPSDVMEVTRNYVKEIQRYAPTGPVSLAAVSLAGPIAFEVARALRAEGRDVALVAFFDALAPGTLEGVGAVARLRLHARELRRRGLPYVQEKLEARVRHARDRLGMLRLRLRQRIGMDVSEDLRVLEFIENNASAAEDHTLLPYEGKLTIFRATEDVFYSEAYKESGLGWGPLAVGGVELIDVPGDHLSMLAEPHVKTLAGKLQAALQQGIDDLQQA